MSVAERGMGFGLKAIRGIAGLEVMDRVGLRAPAERALYRASRNGFRGASAASRTFTAASRLGRAARPATAQRRDLFDLTPDDEQQMLRAAMREFAAGELRPAASAADEACAAPEALVAQSAELGLAMLGVPEELDGAAERALGGDRGARHRGARPRRHGPGRRHARPRRGQHRARAVGRRRPAGGLPARVRRRRGPPAAALALLEPRPLFDPFALRTTRAQGGEG